MSRLKDYLECKRIYNEMYEIGFEYRENINKIDDLEFIKDKYQYDEDIEILTKNNFKDLEDIKRDIRNLNNINSDKWEELVNYSYEINELSELEMCSDYVCLDDELYFTLDVFNKMLREHFKIDRFDLKLIEKNNL